MNVKHDSQKGFTLVEIIIAIAALALICGFVLQILILAAKVNDRAIDKQFAIIESSNVIEVLNSLEKMDDIQSDSYFLKAEITTEGNSVIISQYYEEYGVSVVTSLLSEINRVNVTVSAYKNDRMILGDELKASVRFKEQDE